METKTSNSRLQRAFATAVSLIIFALPVFAQGRGGTVRTDTKIVYHNGPVMPGQANVYMIWYGNFGGTTTPTILTDLVANIGGSSYFTINATYTDASGNGPSGAVLYSGTRADSYSRGASLKPSDIQGVVRDLITAGFLPLDNSGIYVVFASRDVTDNQPDGTTFCTPNSFPHHGSFVLNGTTVKYGFIGDADRCDRSVAPWFTAPDGTLLFTPNDNFGADVMASNLAHLLSVAVTSPLGNSARLGGWYDRYGFENAAKCYGTFGQTYRASNGGPANIRLGQRDYMLQQNWVNGRKGLCAMTAPAP